MDFEKSRNLETLLRRSEEASRLYVSLPDYVKEQLKTRADSINSMESLMDYVENLTRGEG